MRMALFSARHPGLALATASFTCSVHRLLHVPLVWPTYFFPVVPTATYINPCPCFGMCRSRSPRVSSAPLRYSNPASHQSQGLVFDAHHFAVAARRSCRWRDQRATQTRPCALPLAPCAHSRTPLAVSCQVKQQVESQVSTFPSTHMPAHLPAYCATHAPTAVCADQGCAVHRALARTTLARTPTYPTYPTS